MNTEHEWLQLVKKDARILLISDRLMYTYQVSHILTYITLTNLYSSYLTSVIYVFIDFVSHENPWNRPIMRNELKFMTMLIFTVTKCLILALLCPNDTHICVVYNQQRDSNWSSTYKFHIMQGTWLLRLPLSVPKLSGLYAYNVKWF